MPWPTSNALAMHSFGAGVFVAPYEIDVSTVAIAPAVGTPLSGTWAEVGQMLNATAPAREPGDTKVTHTKSTGKANEYIPGWIEGGQATIRLHYNSATYLALQSLMSGVGGVSPDWQRYTWAVQLPDGGCFFFCGFLKGTPVNVPGADSDDPVALDITIRVSGDVFFDSP